MIELSSKYVRIDDVVTFLSGDRLLIHNLLDDTFATVGETGKFIWELLDGNTSGIDIVARMCSNFDVPKEVAESDCKEFLEELIASKLIARRS